MTRWYRHHVKPVIVPTRQRPCNDQTSRRLFFQLLRYARELRGKNHFVRRACLLGMQTAFLTNYEDFRTADKMRDFNANILAGNKI